MEKEKKMMIMVNQNLNGKGKEYDNYGNMIFDGEYSTGKKKIGKE